MKHKDLLNDALVIYQTQTNLAEIIGVSDACMSGWVKTGTITNKPAALLLQRYVTEATMPRKERRRRALADLRLVYKDPIWSGPYGDELTRPLWEVLRDG